MKNTVLALLTLILIVAIVNLLVGLGVVGGASGSSSAGSSYDYKALNAQQMDAIGFKAIAAEEGLDISEEGEINFPKEMVDKISKNNMLPRTILEVEKDGGWEFVSVTSDNYYIFRKAK